MRSQPTLTAPGRKIKGKLTASDRPAQWVEVSPGLFLRGTVAKAMRQLVRKHGCTSFPGEAAGYSGMPTLTVQGPGKRYTLRLFTATQLAVEPARKKPTAAPRF